MLSLRSFSSSILLYLTSYTHNAVKHLGIYPHPPDSSEP